MDKEEIERLCREYNFSWSILGRYIKIKSKRDTYYILDIDYEGRQIKLYHQNEQHDSGKHSHGKHNNLRCTMKSIQSHDNIFQLGSRNNKYERLMMMFDQIHLQYA